MTFPLIRRWGCFICEACTVRAFLQRELRPNDLRLLLLERMRMIDIAWNWQMGTHISYQTHLNKITSFEERYGVTVLRPLKPKRPPTPPDIPLMWCLEERSLQMASHISRGGEVGPVSFGTIRGIRSAAAQFYQVNALVGAPYSSMLNKEGKLIHQVCRPTDGAALAMFAKGLSKRIGTEVMQSKPLTQEQVMGFDEELNSQFALPLERHVLLDIARAGLMNCFMWLGWLRPQECLDLTRTDVKRIISGDDEYDLPPGVNVLQLRLSPETKSSPDRRADVIIASPTNGGLNALRWFFRVTNMMDTEDKKLFMTRRKASWKSTYFKNEYLIPYLEQRERGSSTAIDYFSLNCYRRGARTHVDNIILNRSLLRRSGFTESALKAMIYEHGRWRMSSSSDPIDVTYRGWSIEQRLRLTLHMF